MVVRIILGMSAAVVLLTGCDQSSAYQLRRQTHDQKKAQENIENLSARRDAESKSE